MDLESSFSSCQVTKCPVFWQCHLKKSSFGNHSFKLALESYQSPLDLLYSNLKQVQLACSVLHLEYMLRKKVEEFRKKVQHLNITTPARTD